MHSEEYIQALADELTKNNCMECPFMEMGECQDFLCDVFVAVNALEKSIGMKPTPNTNKYKRGPKYECPRCHEPLKGAWMHQYCSECGQLIDWRKTK